ncbi:hypothetical protein KL771_02165 [Hyphomicrobiaceae bacterium 22]|uniref:Uncharacterized protein n=1 Tax=Prosthecodimorpha staleyi TaxID=2840188 RepID=A0A947D273_9HYPH|nr:hypothetical protein [Prosthecodimorpha staleyi]
MTAAGGDGTEIGFGTRPSAIWAKCHVSRAATVLWNGRREGYGRHFAMTGQFRCQILLDMPEGLDLRIDPTVFIGGFDEGAQNPPTRERRSQAPIRTRSGRAAEPAG